MSVQLQLAKHFQKLKMFISTGRRMSAWDQGYGNQNGPFGPPPPFIDELDHINEQQVS